MIDILLVLALLAAGIATALARYYREALITAKAWIAIYGEEAAEARAQVDDLQKWCDAWEDRALTAEAALLKLQGRHDDLQALYCHQVRSALAANSWIIFRSKEGRKD